MFENVQKLVPKDIRSTIAFMPKKKRSTIEKKAEKAYVRGLVGGAFRGCLFKSNNTIYPAQSLKLVLASIVFHKILKVANDICL